MKYRLFLIWILFPFILQAQENKNYNSLKIKALLSINPYIKEVKGKVYYTLKMKKNARFIKIDAPELYVTKVKKGWFNQRYSLDGKFLTIYRNFKKGKTYTFAIEYTASPKKAMYFTGWNYPGARKQIWTQGQGKGNSHWIPVNEDQNDKLRWEIQVVFDKNYEVVSNGILKNKKKINDSLIKWNYIQNFPSSSYLMFLGIGKYLDKAFVSQSGIKVHNYLYPDKTKHNKTYYKSKDIFDFIENEIGVPYPWDNYKQIPLRDFLYGGMENIGVSSFNGNRYIIDSIEFNDINFVNVSAHELAHQWFGDLVTGKSSSDHWLHEGFATYYARLNDKNIFGKDYSDYEIYRYDEEIKKAAEKDTIPIHRPNASSLSYYQKGARVVQMLRMKTGDSLYKKTIAAFLKKYRFKNAGIENFQRELYLQTGDSLNNFFNLWLNTTKIPSLNLKYTGDSLVFIKNEIPQNIPFLFIFRDSIQKKYLNQSYKIEKSDQLLAIIPNTDNALLMKLDFNSPTAWLQNQAIRSPYFIDRYIALKKLIKKQKSDSVGKILLNRKEFYPVYNLIASEAIRKKDYGLINIFLDKDLKTRQFIARNLDSIPKILKKKYRNLIEDPSYITKEAVLWNYAKNFPAERNGILEKTKNITGGNDKSFRLTWLGLALITPEYKIPEKKQFLKEIIEYTSPKYNMDVRLNAFYLLKSLHYFNEEIIDNLMNAALHFNWRFHSPARKILKEIYQDREYKSIILSLLDSKYNTQKSFFNKLFKLP